MICSWLSDDELREIGWKEEWIRNGLVSQVAAFFFVKHPEDVYSIERNLIRGVYDLDENVTFRGEQWAALITTWV